MKKPECPYEFDARFGYRLVKFLGGDPSKIYEGWCWKDFAKHYPELRKPAEQYFESATTGNPSWAAYWMCIDCGSSREWAEGVRRK